MKCNNKHFLWILSFFIKIKSIAPFIVYILHYAKGVKISGSIMDYIEYLICDRQETFIVKVNYLLFSRFMSYL